MTTEYQLQPRYEEVSFRGRFAAKMRGLWKMEGDFMGGPGRRWPGWMKPGDNWSR